MISHLMNNPNFSNAINQANNNRNNAQVNAKSDSVDDKKINQEGKVSRSRLETIKEAVQNGTYKIDLRGSAEKLAQELLR